MLRDFAIRSRTIWPPNRTSKNKSFKGYRRSQFEETWVQYCADDGTASHGSNIKSLRRVGGSGRAAPKEEVRVWTQAV
jgi:hypothetical protein